MDPDDCPTITGRVFYLAPVTPQGVLDGNTVSLAEIGVIETSQLL